MEGPALTQLIPLAEMTPGQVGAIRNQVVTQLVRLVASELNMASEKLVVRDVRPFRDLAMYAAGTTAATIDEWLYDATTTTADAFTTVTGSGTMADQRWVAIFGVRDLRRGVGVHTTGMGLFEATTFVGDATSFGKVADLPGQVVSLVKINVGGSDKVIWDLTSFEGYTDKLAGFSPSAIIIPQNSAFNIYYYFKTTAAGIRAYLQLIGIVVEPRGKVVSP